MARAFFSHHVEDRDGNVRLERRLRPNLRTTAGLDWQAAVMGKITSQPLGMGYIALSSDTGNPNVADTVLASEYTGSGLARAAATYAHTGGASNFSLFFTFTATASANINKTALFNASSGGTMGFESLEGTPVQMNTGDVDTQTTVVSI